MSSSREKRLSPVEVLIFSVVGGIVLQSIYSLVHHSNSYQATALTPMLANPISEGRSLASQTSPLATLELTCEPKVTKQTDATKARLFGPICGEGNTAENTKTIVTHTTTKMPATVFPDLKTNQFSTDYISLSPGENTIQVKFTSPSGQMTQQELIVVRQSHN